MPQRFSSLRRRLSSAGLVVVTACMGGQSGSEGDPVGPPCAYGATVLRAHVTEIGGGCVGVEVEELVSAGQPVYRSDGSVSFDGTAQSGDTLRGRLGRVYAYTHQFQLNEEVAVFVTSHGADSGRLDLQLFPFVDDRAQVDWNGGVIGVTLDELVAADCPKQFTAKYGEPNYDDVEEYVVGDPQIAVPGAAALPECNL